jgi:hypothetical protein
LFEAKSSSIDLKLYRPGNGLVSAQSTAGDESQLRVVPYRKPVAPRCVSNTVKPKNVGGSTSSVFTGVLSTISLAELEPTSAIERGADNALLPDMAGRVISYIPGCGAALTGCRAKYPPRATRIHTAINAIDKPHSEKVATDIKAMPMLANWSNAKAPNPTSMEADVRNSGSIGRTQSMRYVR